MKRKFLPTISLMLCFAVFLCMMTGCSRHSDEEESSWLASWELEDDEDEDLPPELRKHSESSNDDHHESLDYINPLTGLPCKDNIDNKLPVAIMINNIAEAQPLLGVSEADVIYEGLVEGGITRLLAVYKDISSVGTVGTIRSARPPFIDLAYSYNGIFIHCGTSKQAEEKLKQAGSMTKTFDLGNYDWAWRDNDRLNSGYDVEHTLVSDGQSLATGLKNAGVDMDSCVRYPQQFGICSSLENGYDAESVNVTFSNYKSTCFEYDSKKKIYNVSQYGEDMMDSTYHTNVKVENIIVIGVKNYMIDDEHVGLELLSSGTGYYISGGKAIKINWSKLTEESPIYYTTEEGRELIMNPGRQYVCCVPPEYENIF